MSSFENLALDPFLFKAIKEKGYKVPTPIQNHTIPKVLAGKDLIVSSQTGSGKTAAFIIPALQYLTTLAKTNRQSGKPYILILTPTRELANQISEIVRELGKFLRFTFSTITGGMPHRKQLQALTKKIDIIVATPGRLLDHLQSRKIDLSDIKMLILDEADRMLDMNFLEDVKYIIKKTPKKRQTLLFSATIDKQLITQTYDMLNNPEQINLVADVDQKNRIEQRLYLAKNSQHKLQLLNIFLTNENIHKAIIFSAMKIDSDKLAKQLCSLGYTACALHGDLKQEKRNNILNKLRKNQIKFLVATDVVSRGIDIVDISHVINFDFPKFAESYVHRIGRTGRAGRLGTAISLILPKETRYLKRLESYTGQAMKLIKSEKLKQNIND